MRSWKKDLNEKLKNARKIAILGIGNPDLCDDAAGSIVAERIQKIIGGKNNAYIALFPCYEAPENFTSPVKKEKPTHIVMIDSCLSGRKPGSIFLLMPDEIKNVDVSSHKLPLYLLSDYLKNETGAEIIIIGIEPELLCKGNFLSKAVESAVNEISDWFSEFFKKSFQV